MLLAWNELIVKINEVQLNDEKDFLDDLCIKMELSQFNQRMRC